MNFNNENESLLEKWLEDQSFINWARQRNDVDSAYWEHYFNQHPEHWKLAKAAKRQILGISFQPIPTDSTRAVSSLNTLLSQINDKSESTVQPDTYPVIRRMRPLLAAASIAGILLLSGITYFQFYYDAETTLATKYGEILETQLPDGSTVILNSNSTLSYHTQQPRKVRLTGEAFFKVEKKPATREKFQVITPDLKVVVLGTAFNVNSRNDQTKIFLEEGKVNLEIENDEKETVQMQAGDLITYSKKHNQLKEKREKVSVLENTSWKEGTLIFNEKPLSKALYEIEDIYGIQFVYQSEKIKNEIISGGVPTSNLKVTLQILQEVYGINMKVEGNRYFISGKEEQE